MVISATDGFGVRSLRQAPAGLSSRAKRARGREDGSPNRGRRGVVAYRGGQAIIAAFAALALSACSNPGKTSLDTNEPLKPAPDLRGTAAPGTVVWRSPDLAEHERAASSYLIPMAEVYRGKGSSFGNLPPAQVDKVAEDLTRAVRTAIGGHFKVVSAPGPGVFTLQLIVVKIDPPHDVYIANGPYDFSSSVIGMPNSQPVSSGELVVSGKFTDAASGKLLVGFVSPVHPEGMDVGASVDANDISRFTTLATQQFASELTASIVRTRQRNKVSSLQ